jgi:hypothetical protein
MKIITLKGDRECLEWGVLLQTREGLETEVRVELRSSLQQVGTIDGAFLAEETANIKPLWW